MIFGNRSCVKKTFSCTVDSRKRSLLASGPARVLGAAALAALAAALLWACSNPGADAPDAEPAARSAPEPEFEGRPLSRWIAQLDSPDWKQRYDAAETLGRMGADAEPAAEELARLLLEDMDRDVRAAAAGALAALNREAYIDIFIEALGDEDPEVLLIVCDILAEIGAAAVGAVDALERLAADGERNPGVALFAHYALAAVTGRLDDRVAAMREIMEAEERDVCELGVVALAALGEPAARLVPPLAGFFGNAKDWDALCDELCPVPETPRRVVIQGGRSTGYVPGSRSGSRSGGGGGQSVRSGSSESRPSGGCSRCGQ